MESKCHQLLFGLSVLEAVKAANSGTQSTCSKRPQRLVFALQNNVCPANSDFLGTVLKALLQFVDGWFFLFFFFSPPLHCYRS